MFVHKIDDRIALRLIDQRDAEQVFTLTNNSRSYLREWLPWVDYTTKIEDTKAFIDGSLKGFAENKSLTSVILVEGKLAGVAGFNKIDWSNKIASIGYWLAEEFQGNGIMTKVANALTNYGIEDLQMNKVEIRAAVANKKSRMIPERLGFVQEGTIRQAEWLYDHFVDHVVYGILTNEWLKKT